MAENFPGWLLGIYKFTYACPKRALALRIIDRGSVVLSAAVFFASVYFAFLRDIICAVQLVLLAAIPFALVSIMRLALKSKRPYEVVDFGELTSRPPHYKLGSSFPSRHVFSAFLIAVLAFEFAPWLGVTGLFLGLALAFLRVVLGIHFPRDVICGALIGVVSGVIGILIL